jgi:hypothetical protein
LLSERDSSKKIADKISKFYGCPQQKQSVRFNRIHRQHQLSSRSLRSSPLRRQESYTRPSRRIAGRVAGAKKIDLQIIVTSNLTDISIVTGFASMRKTKEILI